MICQMSDNVPIVPKMKFIVVLEPLAFQKIGDVMGKLTAQMQAMKNCAVNLKKLFNPKIFTLNRIEIVENFHLHSRQSSYENSI